jgi:protein-S-isoprenylcysteine O-methyltransferase Ste14
MNDDQIFRTVLLITMLVVLPFGLYHRIRSQSTREKLDRWQEGVFILATLRPIGLIMFSGVIVYLVSPSRMAWSQLPLPVWLRCVGAGLLMAGTGLLMWTFRRLGKNLTDTVVTRRDHTLVTRGPYRWVRHPFYDSAALFMLGISLLAANWFLLVTSSLLFSLLVIRTRIEEQKLLERFGDSYRAYVARTGRFLPRIGAARHDAQQT